LFHQDENRARDSSGTGTVEFSKGKRVKAGASPSLLK